MSMSDVLDIMAVMPEGVRQDYADGAALRRLREALPEHAEVRIHKRPQRDARQYPIGMSGTHWTGVKYGHTVAEAADRCHEALTK